MRSLGNISLPAKCEKIQHEFPVEIASLGWPTRRVMCAALIISAGIIIDRVICRLRFWGVADRPKQTNIVFNKKVSLYKDSAGAGNFCGETLTRRGRGIKLFSSF